jgi:hypothetical protein
MQRAIERNCTPQLRAVNRRQFWIGTLLILFAGIVFLGSPVKSVYTYYHHRASSASWNSTQFRLPPHWYARPWVDDQMDVRMIFTRDNLPWHSDDGIPLTGHHHTNAAIYLIPADSDFADAPAIVLARWEQITHNNISLNDPPHTNIQLMFTTTRNAKEEFRCANTVIYGRDGKIYVDMDCIGTNDGWRFDYEGVLKRQSEALSILTGSK